MSFLETILSGFVLCIISGFIGKVIGEKGKISIDECKDHRKGCSALLCQKIDSLSKRVDELKKAVDGKLLGI